MTNLLNALKIQTLTYDLCLSERRPNVTAEEDLNDLLHDFNLSKDKKWILGLQQQNYTNSFDKDLSIYYYDLFSTIDIDVCCNKIQGLFKSLGINYEPNDWTFYADSPTEKMKTVLLDQWHA